MSMLPRLYILARVEVQLHSLNASGAIGNYTKLQEGYVVVDNETVPVPVITGNALKNWHARAMVLKYLELGGQNVHKQHFEKGMYRVDAETALATGVAPDDRERQAEEKLVKSCAICDVHGFLLAMQAEVEREGRRERVPLPQVRRESAIKSSFAVPIESIVREHLKFIVTHNRVSKRAEEMMIFKREYASSIYGWMSILDLGTIGRSQYQKAENSNLWIGKPIVDKDEAERRAKAAVLAYEAPLTGLLGAATARALPISKVVEIIAILSRNPIPTLIHPFYTNYTDELRKILELYKNSIVKVYGYNVDLGEPASPINILERLAKDVEEIVEKLWRVSS